MRRVEAKGQVDEWLEDGVEEEFVQTMESAGWIAAPNLRRLGRGWPDRFMFGPRGRVVVVEFKRAGARARRGEKLQDYVRKQFEMRGHEVYKVVGRAEAQDLARRLCEGKKKKRGSAS